ncbi:hypothetical protein [Agaribacter flavus]|uniref:Uncharacterized protein n=1 Tax=Agaribacter flavus TaxID=1902781 RepID=A0ABV7FPK8_9ALTE
MSHQPFNLISRRAFMRSSLGCGCLFLASAYTQPARALTLQPSRHALYLPDKPMIAVDPSNPRWLRWTNGKPFFMSGPGDPESFLFRGERQSNGTYEGDQIALMNKVAEAGANCLWWVGMRSHGGDGGPLENMFVDGNPDKGINHAVLDQWEGWLAHAEKLGLVVSFYFYDDQVEVELGENSLSWQLDVSGNLHPQEAQMINEVVKRFSKYGNIIWGAMEVADKRGARFIPHLKAFSKHIRDVDPYSHPIAMSVGFAGDSFADYANDPNIDIYSIMKLERLSADEINQRGLGYYAAAEGRYVCNFAETHGYGKGETARIKNWATAMSGCYLQVHGHHVHNNTLQDLKDCALVSKFFEQCDFYSMQPNNRLARDKTKYVMAEIGKQYILYARESDKESTLACLEIPDGDYQALWVDCISGEFYRESMALKKAKRGMTRITKPKHFGAEVAVYLLRESI